MSSLMSALSRLRIWCKLQTNNLQILIFHPGGIPERSLRQNADYIILYLAESNVLIYPNITPIKLISWYDDCKWCQY